MAQLIGLDWGTSNLRAYLIAGDSEVLETRHRPWGVRSLPDGGFDAALADVCRGWPDRPRLASGMVSGRGGWHEVAYVDLPVDIARIDGALGAVLAADGLPVHLVPGLRNPHRPDVMRGEETQILGALDLRPDLAGASTLVLPGTHSKWARVRDGAVIDFRTAMTGELYALLIRHSILGAGTDLGTTNFDRSVFQRGVHAARDSGAAGALSRVFSVRALTLDGRLALASVPDYLSGLLIGEEIRATLAADGAPSGSPIQLIGEMGLCVRYRAALVEFDLEAAAPIEDAAARGLWRIAIGAGLIHSIAGASPSRAQR